MDLTEFIFVTDEGHTYQPGSEAIDPDIENLQVLGFARGRNAKDALRVMLRERPWLRETTFERAFCVPLAASIRAAECIDLKKYM